jgi:SAM-dependent methyltransferase
MSEFKYVGSELELFAEVRHWKAYWSAQIRRFVKGDVLEVGAGIGSNTHFLDSGDVGRFVCLEPDPELGKRLEEQLSQETRKCEAICGTLASLSSDAKFDTIVYIDVLEHIEDDQAELNRAAARLRAGGRIVVLSPAHQWLFTPFDAAIGHHRRYTRAMLKAISPADLEMESCFYLDSIGLFASCANRLFLKQSMPTKGQLEFWDSVIVRISRIADRCLVRSIGKSIVAIWRRTA